MSGFYKDNPPATQVGSEDATESTIQEDAVTQTDTSGGFYQGSPDQTTTDAYTADALASKNAAEAAKTAAEAAQSAAETAKTAAETAETNAETAETNAETAETNAETAETNAAASQSAAATSATSSAGSAATATTKASEAATSATNAATSATSAETAKTAAETAETNAETAETNAASSASSASTSASNASTSATAASGSASAASTSETNAASSATAAATSATNAATSETNAASSATSASGSATTATTQAGNASTSASNAATSETNAATSATASAASASSASAAKDAALAALDNFDDRYLGQKASDPSVDNDGNALITGALYFDTTNDVMRVYDGSQWLAAYADVSGSALTINNLSDLASAATARTNLGLGSAATTDATAYATSAQADQTVSLTASGATSVSGTYPNFTISSTDTNTEYTAGSGITLTGTTFSNAAPDQTVSLTGSGATSVSGTYPNFTISSTDNNTEYTAGSGITLTGTTFSNSAPDQTVSLTGSGATTISGTYPNFTISSIDTNTDTNTTYSAGTNLSLSGTTFNLNTNLSGVGTISSGAITSSGRGTFDELTLTGGTDNLTFNEASGDWTINNAQQNNGIKIYDGTGGVAVNYNGAAVAQFDGSGGMNLISGSLRVGGTAVIDSSREGSFATRAQFGGVDSAGNVAPSFNNTIVSGYGLISNRSTMYITNGGGVIQLGNGGIHNGDPGLSVETTVVDVGSGRSLAMNGTTVIDSSRNLTNVGTISSGAITVNQNGDALNLRSTTNAQAVRVTFSSDVPDAQIGHIEYTHQDAASYGSNEAIILSGTENQRTILADGKLMFSEGLYIKPASGTGAGTLIISSSGHLRNLGGELRADGTFKMLTEAGAAQLLQTKGVAAGTSYSGTPAYQGEFNALTGYRVGNTAVIDSSRNLVNINSVEIGDKVTLAESTDRADLLQITGTTSGWAGLQIRNSSGEGRWSFMTDGAVAGIYDDENQDWYMQFNELGATEIFHNSAQKLTTTTGGISVTGLVTADSFLSGLGTAASPAFQVGDTNTGFFDSGSNTIGVACNGAHEFNFTAATLDMKGNTITNGGNITLYSSATDARYLHLPRGGGITLYGDGSSHHGIFSRNSGNSATDDILISSYGAVYFDLDSNSNNSSGANFEITKHNGTAAIFKVDGETSDITTLGDIYIPSKILHTGDTDTYTQFHAANQWRVVTGGTERLEVNQGTATVAGTLNVRVAIDLADSDILRLGSGDDVEFFCNGSHMYMDLNSGIGNFYIRDGTTTRYTFNDNGSFTATGNITAYSDRRVKARFEPITDALSKVQQLHGQTYIRTDMDDANRRYAGLIAQDVEAVLPEAVSEVEDHLTLDYSGTIGLLVEAIKELKQEVNDLRAQLEDK